jgi:signal transduction histidine kinase
MNLTGQTIFIICADLAVSRECINELAASGSRYHLPVASSVQQARTVFAHKPPAVIFLDESAIDPLRDGQSLGFSVALLTETAPVVVAAAPEKEAHLAFLISSGAVDFVKRTNNFLLIAAEKLDQRVRMAEHMAGMIHFPSETLPGDFGEILRHEVNNPLTGILGNTELLLAQRDRLPPAAVERLQTIAELAVRLRETVRRLSNAWDENHEHARPA